MSNRGFLAIWSDVTPERETDYLHWMTREHAAERLGIDGFLGVGLYRTQAPDVRRYFIHYELASPAVLASDGYLARLNAPTPWTQRIMPTLGQFARGGGRVVAEAGCGPGHGSVIAVAKLSSPLPDCDVDQLARIAGLDRIVAARWLETDADRTGIATREKAMRRSAATGDASFAGLVLIEGLDAAAVMAAATSHDLGSRANVYSQVFRLDRAACSR